MSKRIEQHHIDFIKRWKAAGYGVESIALALGSSVNTVRSIGLQGARTQFGRKRLPVAWITALKSELYVSENLEAAYARLEDAVTKDGSMDLKALKSILRWVSDDRLQEWRDHVMGKLVVRGKVWLLDSKLRGTTPRTPSGTAATDLDQS